VLSSRLFGSFLVEGTWSGRGFGVMKRERCIVLLARIVTTGSLGY
jgi:hypothetical protein